MEGSLEEHPPTSRQTWRLRRRSALPFAGGVLATLLALLIYRQLFPPPLPLTLQDMDARVAVVLSSATPAPAPASLVYAQIRPSLVLIETQASGSDHTDHGGLGSGVIINDNGNILTCLHVVAGASAIRVTFADGTQSPARVINQQPENDTAVLQAEQLPDVVVPATLGNPNALRVGDDAYVVGSPFGLYASMSAGVISGFERTFQPEGSAVRLTGLIQIDSAVNPGNSGGPLLNRYGHVVGIVEGIVNPTGQEVFIGIGFAMPITTAGGGAGAPPY